MEKRPDAAAARMAAHFKRENRLGHVRSFMVERGVSHRASTKAEKTQTPDTDNGSGILTGVVGLEQRPNDAN